MVNGTQYNDQKREQIYISLKINKNCWKCSKLTASDQNSKKLLINNHFFRSK